MDDWKKEYAKKLDCVDVNKLEIEAAQALKISNMPQRLYKFRSASTSAIKNFRNDTVYLNQPSRYNDPFEFVEYIDYQKVLNVIEEKKKADFLPNALNDIELPEDVQKELEHTESPTQVLINHLLKEIPAEKRQHFLDFMSKIMEEFTLDAHIKKIKFMQEQMKVCSFCESPNHLLMWGHYTNDHKGFCVEYDVSKWPKNDIRNRLIYPVIYQEDIYDATDHFISSIENDGVFNNIYPIISGGTKSLEWGYEKEWRFIFNFGESFPAQDYRMDCQTKIYLGSRMDEKIKSELLEICKEKAIEAYDAIPSVKKYEMEFKPIDLK